MSPQECADLRRQICLEVKIVLQEYWQDTRRGFEMGAAATALWADMLEGWTVDQVRWALRKHMTEDPNRRPNPGHIVAILKRSWGEKQAAELRRVREAEQPNHKGMSRDRHAEVTAEMADKLKSFIKPMPRVQE